MKGRLAALFRLAPAPQGRVALAVVLGALTVLFGAGLMGTAGYLISRAAERPAVLSLMVAIVAVRFFGLGRPVVRYLERLSSHDVALRVLGGVRTHFYERMEPLAPTQLESYRRGDLLSRMVADVDALQNLYLRGLLPVMAGALAAVACVGVAAAVLPAAGVLLAAGLLIGGVGVPVLGGITARAAGARQAPARAELTAEVVGLMRGATELVAFGAVGPQLDRVRRVDRTLVGLARRDALLAGGSDGLGVAVMGLTTAGVLAVVAAASAHGHLNRVLIAMLALLALASFEAVTPLAAAARELSATVVSGGRILELTTQHAEVSDPVAPLPAPLWPFAITLEDVRARYPRQPQAVLDGVWLRLEPGQRVALVGASGAGKSTIVNLLLRFLDPESGRVTVAEHDLRRYRMEDIRRLFAVAGQESHLFTASIRDNIRLARPRAADPEIAEALRRARLWEWVSRLPDGLGTVVGEVGQELSGGQRQRVVLARALLTGAPVLVLDEPTAHLDPETASELMHDVFAAAEHQTVLLITHRTEGLDLVDRVVRLSPGGAGASRAEATAIVGAVGG